MEQYDIIIIGAGPGGLTAGIYAGRQGTRNLIIDRDLAGGIGREVPEMENYPGFDSISGLELIEKNHFRAEVSPGTYIRTLSEDIAKALGTVGHTSYLRRIKDGKFSVEQSITLENLEKFEDNLDSVLIPLENVLDDIPVIPVSCQDAENLMLGRCIPTAFVGADGQYMASADNGFLEIVKFSDGVINPKKLLRSF